MLLESNGKKVKNAMTKTNRSCCPNGLPPVHQQPKLCSGHRSIGQIGESVSFFCNDNTVCFPYKILFKNELVMLKR